METDWVRELAAYAAMRWIDFSIWAELPCWSDEAPGAQQARTVDLPAVPSLLAHVALAGLLGRPWRVTERLGMAGAVDLSGIDFGTRVVDEVLCALYDEAAGQELDWPRRSGLRSELTGAEKARLRRWIWVAQDYGADGEKAQYFGVQISITSLSAAEKQAVLQGVAQAVNALVLNVAPEGAGSDALLEKMVSFSGVSVYDVAEHVQGILRGLRYFKEQSHAESVNQGVPASAPVYEWDVFLSHASEDKVSFVEGLVGELKEVGLKVWYDKEQLKGNKSLGQGLEQGFKQSKHMVAVITKDYLEKEWTIAELEAAQNADPSGREGRLMIILRKISYEELKLKKPFIANRLVFDAASMSGEVLANKINEAIRPSSR